MISKLIEEFSLREEFAPNRIYLTRFSAGGYTPFCIGSKMADRFAAVFAVAGHLRLIIPLLRTFITPHYVSKLEKKTWPITVLVCVTPTTNASPSIQAMPTASTSLNTLAMGFKSMMV